MPQAYNEVENFVKEVMESLQIHRCLVPSCGKPPAGKTGCRFAMPRACGPGCEVTEPRLFVARKSPNGGLCIQVLPVDSQILESDSHGTG